MGRLIYSMSVSLDERMELALVETRTFGTGVVYVRYDVTVPPDGSAQSTTGQIGGRGSSGG